MYLSRLNSFNPMTWPDARIYLLQARLLKYIEASYRQFLEIKKIGLELNFEITLSEVIGNDFENLEDFFIQIHLYFVCYDQCRKLIKKLATLINEDWINKLYDENAEHIEKFKKVRNDMEHFDDRTGDNKTDLGNYNGTKNEFSFQGKTYPIIIEDIKRLFEIYSEFQKLAYIQYGEWGARQLEE